MIVCKCPRILSSILYAIQRDLRFSSSAKFVLKISFLYVSKRSSNAWKEGKFNNEIVPVEINLRNGEKLEINQDEEYKNINFEKVH